MFWEQKSRKQGARFLGEWIIEAIDSGVEQLAKTARTLLHFYEGLLNYFDHKIDNSKSEGINNKIKVPNRGYHMIHGHKCLCYQSSSSPPLI